MIEYKPENNRGELSQEVIDFIQNKMKSTSEKPVKIPRKLYHATPQRNLSSILENGLKPHEIFGEIYFCEKEKHCQTFLPSPAIIFCIDSSKLDSELIFLSKDHKKVGNRKFDCFTYYGHISPELCRNWRRI